MNKRKKFIVLDVEGYSNTRPYNVGFIVADKYGTIYEKYNFAFTACIMENIRITSDVAIMTKVNIEEILTDEYEQKYKKIAINDFIKLFTSTINKYKITQIFAYNVSFDKYSIKRLIGEDIFNSLNIEWCDIISGIVQTRLLTKKYVQFAQKNGFMTEKNHIMTKAEVVYKYLTNCMDFVEEHTGLADALIEYQILLSVFAQRKKVNFAPICAWRIIDKFIKENNL